ncbi:hypothetical protein D910_10187 [Dendroctonus ponderosae]|uniref:DUF4794 domain-containing protein n=1 Tax=Dendroctonus ponderosae TaxID=77166 RepID=U4URW1_DENPD|nr:hypothetical protein D910_10187 [Dendroctonus ponderosae]
MQLELIFLLLLEVSRGAPNDGFPILNPGGIGGIFKGPDSETIIRGPDGSQISSEQTGGSIVSPQGFAGPIVAADAAISSEPPLIDVEHISSPLPVDVKPIEIVQQDPHIIETEIVAAPDVEPEQSSDLKGPSGRIITKEPRKVIVAPARIAPELLVDSLPVLSSTVAPLVSSAEPLVPLGLSTTVAPVELGYSTEAPLTLVDSGRIDLGQVSTNSLSLPDVASGSVPEVEYSSSFGVLHAQELPASGRLYASTDLPPAASTLFSPTTGKNSLSLFSGDFAAAGALFLAGHLLPPDALAESTVQSISSTASPNIQKIRRVEEERIAADGRIDLGDSVPPKPTPQSSYQIPQVLSLALSKFYEKSAVKDGNGVAIDDKLGELDQNEIPLATSQGYLLPPDLSQAKYIAPALERQGVDPSQVTLAQVPLSQVNKFTSGYQPGYGRI